MNKIQIDVYSNKNSNILKIINEIKNKLEKYSFSFYETDDPPPPIKEIGKIIIFEETSTDNPFEKLAKIYNSYKNAPLVIVTSEKPDYKNAVKWMKKFAIDYISSEKEYTPDEFENIINDTLIIKFNADEKEKDEPNPFSSDPVSLEVTIDWDSLKEDQSYQMSILMASVRIRDDQLCKYSKEQIDDISLKIEKYITKRAMNMGGYKLFCHHNDGLFLFHFGDRVNLATLSAISILNKINIYCIERLFLNENFDIKLTLHDGDIIFSKKEAKFISSDAINAVFHLKNIDDSFNTLYVTENIYTKLNPRLKTLFYPYITFEGREIFSYYLKFYQPYL